MVEVEFYRADLTDLPFCFGDTCFYLVSKFADLPMADMLKPGKNQGINGDQS